jgi:hypothetical protein
MRHLLLAVLMYAASLASWAQAYNPTVAYTKLSGSTHLVYVANADGSGAVAVYSTRSPILSIDIAPGGGRIAFSERDKGLKVLSYAPTATGITVTSVVTLDPTTYLGPVDFSPDGRRILYAHQNGLRLIDAAGGTWHVLDAASFYGITLMAWLASGDKFAYVQSDASSLTMQLRVSAIDAYGGTTPWPTPLFSVSATTNEIEFLTSARTRDTLLFHTRLGDGSYGTVELTLDATPQIVNEYTGVRNARLSSDDSKLVYLGGNVVNSRQLPTGPTTALTKKGSYVRIDTRPPAPAP